MASLRALAFDQDGRPVAFDTWHDDSKDNISLFDHVSSAAPAPSARAHDLTRSQWLSRDATARLAIRNHLPASPYGGLVSSGDLLKAQKKKKKKKNPKKKKKKKKQAVGLVVAVEALVAAVEAAEGVAAVEAEGLVVVGLDLSVEALVVVGASSSSVGARPSRPSSSVSG
ncbi:unnamed protein product [Closterium sp. NIES-54]